MSIVLLAEQRAAEASSRRANSYLRRRTRGIGHGERGSARHGRPRAATELHTATVVKCGESTLAWPDMRLAAEYESIEWHAWRMLRKTLGQAQESRTILIVVDDVEANLAAGPHRLGHLDRARISADSRVALRRPAQCATPGSLALNG